MNVVGGAEVGCSSSLVGSVNENYSKLFTYRKMREVKLRLINLKRHIDYFSKGPKSSRTDRTFERFTYEYLRSA